jgi:ATP-dependent Clp protease ATP-binding subunit ClpC
LTERAQEVLRLAGEQARELRHSFIGTEHILLALLLEPEGTAAQVLASFGVSYAQVRTAVVRMMGLGLEQPEGEVALTGPAQDVIDRARREASIRDERQVGTEHILLALLHKRDGAATRILLQLDADPAAIRSALALE